MPALFPVLGMAFADTAAGTAAAAGTTAAAAAGLGLGASALFGPKAPSISIPPPPGAALIDPVGQQAAADTRRRMAAGGGLQSTITGAGTGPNAATAGAKSLSGQ